MSGESNIHPRFNKLRQYREKSRAIREAVKFLEDKSVEARREVEEARDYQDKTVWLVRGGPTAGGKDSGVLSQCFNDSGSETVRDAKFNILAKWITDEFKGEESEIPRLVRSIAYAQVCIRWGAKERG